MTLDRLQGGSWRVGRDERRLFFEPALHGSKLHTMSQRRENESFFPSGAIASFVAMIVFYVGLWLTLYLLMAHRG